MNIYTDYVIRITQGRSYLLYDIPNNIRRLEGIQINPYLHSISTLK